MGKKKTPDELRPADPETEEKKRLRSLAVSQRLLRHSPANPSNPLQPSKSVLKLDGRDIAKRGQRRSRYLFSFPGLIAPLSGGKVGELADLATKNPKLYLEFPQGRMKLFGTHVYPKNKYLTLQLTRSSKGVVCEDCFESMIVFSDAWWIGLKEENPEEKRLEFPMEFKMGEHAGVDFKGGAGALPEEISDGNQPGKEYKAVSPNTVLEDDSQDDSYSLAEKNTGNAMETTPVRQSGRTAGRTQNYAELSSGDDSIANDDEVTEVMDVKIIDTKEITISQIGSSKVAGTMIKSAGKCEESSSLLKSNVDSKKKGTMVQATLSTLFGKVAEKKSKRQADESPRPKGRKRLRLDPEQMADQTPVRKLKKEPLSRRKKTGTVTGTLQKHSQDDDIEDISSESQDLNDSDEDWAAE
ncbi:DNA-binding protein RHL1 isoform X1 [Dioscorea cayenensis subsp. rotundata]|uniref:DNA-binding protein RHL1 isoform X1 n=1 Tax=Dioscorea cayennensis subsp. rotundata TaxID=55577 RepID=A0AB40BEX2_DIOCR|nr:DNA-binding protein RHL1 isoform X1 [Dioscorea cayenensis subsp. rotundata]